MSVIRGRTLARASAVVILVYRERTAYFASIFEPAGRPGNLLAFVVAAAAVVFVVAGVVAGGDAEGGCCGDENGGEERDGEFHCG